MPLSINSMTGYARVSGEQHGLGWAWEVKSVNGRGLDVRTRLPPGYDFLDLPVREAVQKRLKRGNVTVNLTITHKAQQGAVAVNEALLDQLIALSRRWQEKAPDLAAPRLDGLLALRGVLESGEAAEAAGEDSDTAKLLLAECDKALVQLEAMRADEGKRLAEVLTDQLNEIAFLVTDAVGSAALDPVQLKARLRQQVAALLEAGAPVSEDRLAQEVALQLGKADVREELDRLGAHLTAARKMLAAAEPVGRKLDFLCQEFNREANTLCSKSNDIALTRIGLGLKAAIEQFREQVQNIE
ncbi:MAG TPA: YicC/YloC family endoribonuclease [Magnetospirillaceae bacterium]|nr:YicC/YloC family endoribonuclease [Magnetospirillaceae bacterium]